MTTEEQIEKMIENKIILQKERESMRDTLREVQLRLRSYGGVDDSILLIEKILDGYPIGEYILREECEAKVKAAQDAASAFVAQQLKSTKIDA